MGELTNNQSTREMGIALTSSIPSEPKKTCFVAMPITTPDVYAEKLGDSNHFAHVLTHLFTPAVEEAGLTVISPSMAGSELIHAEIIRNLEQADFVLCDISGLNPNVLFELGVRTSLDRPIILVKDDLTGRAPFDVNAINTLTYDSSMTPWSLVNEKPRLVKHIQEVANSGSSGNSMWRYFGLTKRGEPSQAGSNPIEAKLDLLIGQFSKLQPISVVDVPTISADDPSLTRPYVGTRERFIRSLALRLPATASEFELVGEGPHNKRTYILYMPEEVLQALSDEDKSKLAGEAREYGIALRSIMPGRPPSGA
jgi:hypothetical protein